MNTDLNNMGMLDKIIHFCLHNKLIVGILLLFTCLWGVMVAPFDWEVPGLMRDPVPVDAIPDIGENQQIVFTQWMGRSPQDVEDQVSYPLTVALLGIPGVKTVRTYSFFGFSSIYVIFKEDVEFYWSRSRVIEKLNSLPPGTLPDGVQPSLGPDATALGQVFWYTLEGRDSEGEPAGGWNLDELRSIQDWQVRYSLLAADGIAEVASVGGHIKEYQIDVDPDAMRAHRVTIEEIFKAVKMSNIDVGARSIELNGAEYVIRGLGFIKNLDDVRNTVIKSNDHVPITVDQIAKVSYGPALRRGALDKSGAEAVGGVAVVRYGENPLQAIKNIKEKIKEISEGLPKKTLDDGTVSQVTIVPFYDRSGLIKETLGTLDSAITQQVLVTIVVILLMVFHLRSAMLISVLLPIAVLMTFISMKISNVPANIVALSGIAIAIGTIVDMGVILCENILKHLEKASKDRPKIDVIFEACSEVGSAVATAVATTVVSFLPVFTMEAAEGKLFKPLAYTKTFALIASIVVSLTMIPPFAHLLFTMKADSRRWKNMVYGFMALGGATVAWFVSPLAGLIIIAFAGMKIVEPRLPKFGKKVLFLAPIVMCVLFVVTQLSSQWLPLGPEKGEFNNILFVAMIFITLLGFFWVVERIYVPVLRIMLQFKLIFLCLPLALTLWGGMIWLGFDKVFFWLPDSAKKTEVAVDLKHDFPGLGKEFMPNLDEGSFLYMPTTMPHASIGEAMDAMKKIDMAMSAIPEVESVVGKLGRADTPLDPAPISMVETVINYKSEYILDEEGHRVNFRYNQETSNYPRDKEGELIPDSKGRPYRQWRPEIQTADDIWDELVKAAEIPGVTSAPKLQPIAARIVMLQSGMRAPMGVKVKGPNLETIEKVGMNIEKYLKEVPSVEASAVLADRIVGKPYLEIDVDRKAAARYGIKVQQVQMVIETAVGGMKITSSVEGRERYPIRLRYLREKRDSIEELKDIHIPSPSGAQIPLEQLADIRYVRGPMVIKSEDTFLVGYVLFDKKSDFAEVDVVEHSQKYLQDKIDSGEFEIPAGVSYSFAGSYENQVRSEKKLMIVLPLALFAIFMLIYFQFKSVIMTTLVFSGIFVAWSGGFQMIWLYSQDWFLNFSLFDMNMRELFNIHPYNLSVAVWVGFLALFGIATDDGVMMLTYIKQRFAASNPKTVGEIRQATLEAAQRRIRPCLMTSATTIIALLPVLTSTGRGSDVMVPMAIPSFGGMTVVLITVFVVPTLSCLISELKLKFSSLS
ncbi:MAG: efflux RND transporter permease subunit [Planctomycetes bacterium]|nr:efflux RND transporter permease subunit [Planctomycetota bacterium]